MMQYFGATSLLRQQSTMHAFNQFTRFTRPSMLLVTELRSLIPSLPCSSVTLSRLYECQRTSCLPALLIATVFYLHISPGETRTRLLSDDGESTTRHEAFRHRDICNRCLHGQVSSRAEIVQRQVSVRNKSIPRLTPSLVRPGR